MSTKWFKIILRNQLIDKNRCKDVERKVNELNQAVFAGTDKSVSSDDIIPSSVVSSNYDPFDSPVVGAPDAQEAQGPVADVLESQDDQGTAIDTDAPEENQ